MARFHIEGIMVVPFTAFEYGDNKREVMKKLWTEAKGDPVRFFASVAQAGIKLNFSKFTLAREGSDTWDGWE